MLRIATWYETSLGRNDGNPLYVTTFLQRTQYFCDIRHKRNENRSLLVAFPGGRVFDPHAEEFAKWFMETIDEEGFEISCLRPHGDWSAFGKFDLNIWVDWGEDGLKGILPYEYVYPPAKPLIYWASDTHLGYDYRLKSAKKADLVFCAQKRAVEEFARDGVTSEWLPHAFEPLAYPRLDLASKNYDVCFVGHVNSDNRMDALDCLFREFPNFFFGQRRFEKAADIYARSRISFNKAMIDDLNMRVFEVLGSGGLLLTDDIPTIHDFFKDRIHLVLYRNHAEMVELARYYIDHDEERQKIAHQGYLEAINHHTIAHRVRQMFERVPALLGGKVHV